MAGAVRAVSRLYSREIAPPALLAPCEVRLELKVAGTMRPSKVSRLGRTFLVVGKLAIVVIPTAVVGALKGRGRGPGGGVKTDGIGG